MDDQTDNGAARPAQPKLTKKQRRKALQRRQLLTFLIIVILVAVVAFIVWRVQSRPDKQTAPQDLRITAVVDGKEQEIAP
ncbi:MAG TPA: DUF2771 domain-containing protein, partial [Corynebacterium nuruki]|nr:DUF2771 domain-containing protein [Corynebacterium nuruki]